MTTILTITLAIMAAAVVLTLLAIRRYPLRILRRGFTCPVWNVPVRVSFARSEVAFGSFGVTDVEACSLFPMRDEAITCDKRCMHR